MTPAGGCALTSRVARTRVDKLFPWVGAMRCANEQAGLNVFVLSDMTITPRRELPVP